MQKRPVGATKHGPYDKRGFLQRNPILSQTPLASYTLTSDVGLFALNGSDANVVPSYSTAMSAGLFALVGQGVLLRQSRSFGALTGVFAETGEADRLLQDRILSAQVGVFGLTNIVTAIRAQHSIAAATGALVLTGQTAGLLQSRKILSAFGSFGLVGIETSALTAFSLRAQSGAFSLRGSAASLGATEEAPIELPVSPPLSGGGIGGSSTTLFLNPAFRFVAPTQTPVTLEAKTGYFTHGASSASFRVSTNFLSDQSRDSLQHLLLLQARQRRDREIALLLTQA